MSNILKAHCEAWLYSLRFSLLHHLAENVNVMVHCCCLQHGVYTSQRIDEECTLGYVEKSFPVLY